MTNVIACIDGSNVTSAVCDASGWAAFQLNAPVILLHVLDKSAYPIESDLSGNMALLQIVGGDKLIIPFC